MYQTQVNVCLCVGLDWVSAWTGNTWLCHSHCNHMQGSSITVMSMTNRQNSSNCIKSWLSWLLRDELDCTMVYLIQFCFVFHILSMLERSWCEWEERNKTHTITQKTPHSTNQANSESALSLPLYLPFNFFYNCINQIKILINNNHYTKASIWNIIDPYTSCHYHQMFLVLLHCSMYYKIRLQLKHYYRLS